MASDNAAKMWILSPRRRSILCERGGSVCRHDRPSFGLRLHCELLFDRYNWPLLVNCRVSGADIRLTHFFSGSPRIYVDDWRVILGPAHFLSVDLRNIVLDPFQYCQFQSCLGAGVNSGLSFDSLADSVCAELLPRDVLPDHRQVLLYLSFLTRLCPDPCLQALRANLSLN